MHIIPRYDCSLQHLWIARHDAGLGADVRPAAAALSRNVVQPLSEAAE